MSFYLNKKKIQNLLFIVHGTQIVITRHQKKCVLPSQSCLSQSPSSIQNLLLKSCNHRKKYKYMCVFLILLYVQPIYVLHAQIYSKQPTYWDLCSFCAEVVKHCYYRTKEKLHKMRMILNESQYAVHFKRRSRSIRDFYPAFHLHVCNTIHPMTLLCKTEPHMFPVDVNCNSNSIWCVSLTAAAADSSDKLPSGLRKHSESVLAEETKKHTISEYQQDEKDCTLSRVVNVTV